jgi:hypothetical protein
MLHARDVQHFFCYPRQPIGVLLNHARKPFLCGVVQIFFQQCIGLHDGCQRVSDLMRDGGGHPTHGRELFGAQAGFHLAQVVQEHHAKPLGI